MSKAMERDNTWHEAMDAIDMAEEAAKRLGWLYPGSSETVQAILDAKYALIHGTSPRDRA